MMGPLNRVSHKTKTLLLYHRGVKFKLCSNIEYPAVLDKDFDAIRISAMLSVICCACGVGKLFKIYSSSCESEVKDTNMYFV